MGGNTPLDLPLQNDNYPYWFSEVATKRKSIASIQQPAYSIWDSLF